MAPKYPAIPEPTIDPASLRDAVLSLKQAFEILTGQRGGGQDAAVTPGDFNSGMDAKVSKSGDTMTGSLIIRPPTVSAALQLDKTANSTANNLHGTRGNLQRWLMRLGNDIAESTANVGSDFDLYRYADDGAYLGQAAHCNRASGVWTFSTSLTAVGSIDTGGSYYLNGRVFAASTGVNGLNYIYTPSAGGALLLGGSSDPTNYYRNGTHIFQNLAASVHYCTFHLNGANFGGGAGTAGWNPGAPISAETAVTSNWTLAVKSIDRGILYLATGTVGYPGYFTQGTTSNNVGSINHNTTTTTYSTTSDERKKEDFKSFDAGDVLDRIDVHDFRWKTSRERAHGVVAQQVIKVYPEAVHHDPELDYWAVDYSKFVPLLLQEIKVLRERVKALEADK